MILNRLKQYGCNTVVFGLFFSLWDRDNALMFIKVEPYLHLFMGLVSLSD